MVHHHSAGTDRSPRRGSEAADVKAGLRDALRTVGACGAMVAAGSDARASSVGHGDGASGDAGVDTADAVAILDLLVRLEGAVAAASTQVLAVLNRAGHIRAEGAASTTAWLADRYRLAGRDASRRARRGKVLTAMPDTLAALRSGAVTVDHVDTIVEATVTGTFGNARKTEAALLPAASDAAVDDFRRDVRRRKVALDADRADRDARQQFRRRSLRFSHHADGTVGVQGLLHPTAGTQLEQLVQAMVQPDPADTPPDQRRTPDQRRADGLLDLIEGAARAGVPPESGGVRPHLSVLVPYEALVERAGQGSSEAPARVAELQGHGAVAPAVLQRLLCDADISRIVTRGRSEVLDVGRATRVWPTATRKAVIARDRHCRWPGCSRPAAWCDVHHVSFWEDGGATNQANGVLLCSFHHHRVHDDGWSLQMDAATARVTVSSPDGATHRTSDPPGFDPPGFEPPGFDPPGFDPRDVGPPQSGSRQARTDAGASLVLDAGRAASRTFRPATVASSPPAAGLAARRSHRPAIRDP